MRLGVPGRGSASCLRKLTIHRRLEKRIAEFKGSESCLLFGSGYWRNNGIRLRDSRVRRDVVSQTRFNQPRHS